MTEATGLRQAMAAALRRRGVPMGWLDAVTISATPDLHLLWAASRQGDVVVGLVEELSQNPGLWHSLCQSRHGGMAYCRNLVVATGAAYADAFAALAQHAHERDDEPAKRRSDDRYTD